MMNLQKLKKPIFAILLLGLALRLLGINFGLPYLYDPDEFTFVEPAIRMIDKGDLNPHWFGHPGSIMMYVYFVIFYFYFAVAYLLRIVPNVEGFVRLFINNPTIFYMTGRLIITLAGIGAIYATYLVAKRMFNEKSGLVAALCLAVAPLHVQYSRLIRGDVPETFFIMFAIFFLIEYSRTRQQRSLIFSSICVGFAIAAKYIAVIAMIPVIGYCLSDDFKNNKPLTATRKALVFIFLGFFIFAPYVILDNVTAIRDVVRELRTSHLGHERLPGALNYLWYIMNTLRGGIGGAFFEIMAALGILIAVTRRSINRFMLISFPIAFFLIVGNANLRWDRWMIPLLPFEAIFAGVGFISAYEYLLRQPIFRGREKTLGAIFVSILIGAIIFPLGFNLRQGLIMTRTDTRTAAKDWADRSLTPGTKIAFELYAPHLFVRPRPDFKLMNMMRYGIQGIVRFPLAYYRDKGVDILIITDSLKGRYYAEPEKYKREISRYEEIEANCDLVMVFERKEDVPGPRIEVYRIRK